MYFVLFIATQCSILSLKVEVNGILIYQLQSRLISGLGPFKQLLEEWPWFSKSLI
jgi:hypothetical protein